MSFGDKLRKVTAKTLTVEISSGIIKDLIEPFLYATKQLKDSDEIVDMRIPGLPEPLVTLEIKLRKKQREVTSKV